MHWHDRWSLKTFIVIWLSEKVSLGNCFELIPEWREGPSQPNICKSKTPKRMRKSMCLKHDAHGKIGTRGGQGENQETHKVVAYRSWVGFGF